jgi:hypothetical protein
MADVKKRRPLPALICLLALTLLTALVWWRVLHRSDGKSEAKTNCPTQTTQAALPRPATVAVSVLNSTSRTGIAKSAAAALAKGGFTVSGYGNDTGHAAIPGVAEIRYGPEQRGAATLLGYYLPGAKLVALTAPKDSTVIVSLGVKYRAVASAAAVKAAMSAAHVSIAPTGKPKPTVSPTC